MRMKEGPYARAEVACQSEFNLKILAQCAFCLILKIVSFSFS